MIRLRLSVWDAINYAQYVKILPQNVKNAPLSDIDGKNFVLINALRISQPMNLKETRLVKKNAEGYVPLEHLEISTMEDNARIVLQIVKNVPGLRKIVAFLANKDFYIILQPRHVLIHVQINFIWIMSNNSVCRALSDVSNATGPL